MEHILDLSRTFARETVWPRFERAFPQAAGRAAMGLVGNGSECFGYDDEQSRDHDCGVDVCLWLAEEDRHLIPEVEALRLDALATLPAELRRSPSAYGAAPRTMTVGDFYRMHVGFPEGPSTLDEWRSVPEYLLALAVNGEVFHDAAGTFTRTRERLLDYVPEDLRLKRLAARCMQIAQTGQYNLGRMAARGDWACVRDTAQRFTGAAVHIVYLLNRVYRPYYKWRYRRLLELPMGGMEMHGFALQLAQAPLACPEDAARLQQTVDGACVLLDRLLRDAGLAAPEDTFFTAHAEEIHARIRDPQLRALPIEYLV